LKPGSARLFLFGVMKSGFVNIFGKPNAGKSTLLNALMNEKLAIVSPKVQTTRHRIKAIHTDEECQIIFSDTPGIIEPRYKLHERMMQAVRSSLEDADLAILLADAGEEPEESMRIFESLRLKVPAVVVINKKDRVDAARLEKLMDAYRGQPYTREVLAISALKKTGLDALMAAIRNYLPEGAPFYNSDDISDLPTRFFVSEMIREKIFQLYEEEVPYHATVLIQEYSEKSTLTKILADIIVQRETQKGILIGDRGSMIKKLGTLARKDIEAFIGRKVFLELFVKVRPKWRDNEMQLREYGY
jgi:GTP-binding protein Era